MKIKIINKGNNPIPTYAHLGDACVDLRANFSEEQLKLFSTDPTFSSYWWSDKAQALVIKPGKTALIPTGLYTEFYEGYLQILSRSGLALKGITVIGGVIDSGYREEIGVILINNSNENFLVYQGDRIAQMLYHHLDKIEFEEVESLDDSDRGSKGLGSTGIN